MGVVSSSVFAIRNGGKVMNGDIGRAPLPIVQLFNTAGDLAKMNIGKVSEQASAFMERVDDVGKMAGVSNAATKITSVTSKVVNPLLCVASGVRIFKDEDKDAAIIEEGLAMGAMFGAERVAKMARGKVNTALKNGSLDGIIKNDTVKKAGAKILEKIGKMGKGQKIALFIAAELLFVGISVAAFDIGKKVGKKITGRDDGAKVKAQGNSRDNPFKT